MTADFGGDPHPDIAYGLVDPEPYVTAARPAQVNHMDTFLLSSADEARTRPEWMSRWQWLLHCIGMCSKERSGYVCKALSPDECPGRPQ